MTVAKPQVHSIASLRPEDIHRYRRRVSLPRKAPSGGRDLFNLMSEEVVALASDDYFFLHIFHEHYSRSFSRFFAGSPKAPLQDAHEVLWSIIMSHNAPGLSVPKNIQGGFFNWSTLKMTKCQITCKSLQKSSKCQKFLRVWHLVIFWADQLKKPPCI